MNAVMLLEREPEVEEAETPRLVGLGPIPRHPENMHHRYLDRLLRTRSDIAGTPVAALAEALRDWAVSA